MAAAACCRTELTTRFGMTSSQYPNNMSEPIDHDTVWPELQRARRAIVVVDVVESVRLMQADEVGVIDRWRRFVNLAARLTTLAGSGKIVVSAEARDALTDGLDAALDDLGDCYMKHIDAPVLAVAADARRSKPDLAWPAGGRHGRRRPRAHERHQRRRAAGRPRGGTHPHRLRRCLAAGSECRPHAAAPGRTVVAAARGHEGRIAGSRTRRPRAPAAP